MHYLNKWYLQTLVLMQYQSTEPEASSEAHRRSYNKFCGQFRALVRKTRCTMRRTHRRHRTKRRKTKNYFYRKCRSADAAALLGDNLQHMLHLLLCGAIVNVIFYISAWFISLQHLPRRFRLRALINAQICLTRCCTCAKLCINKDEVHCVLRLYLGTEQFNITITTEQVIPSWIA